MVQRASLFGHDYGLVLWNGVERCFINLKVSNDQFGWRVPEPFRECEILIKAALEHLQELKLSTADVLDIMRQGFLDIANISSLKVHGAGTASCSEHRHSSATADVVLPFVGVRMPMQFADSTGDDGNDRGCDRGGDFEHARIDDRDFATLCTLCNLHLGLAESKILRR